MTDTHHLGIVARKSDKYQSGYEAVDHVRNENTLVNVDISSIEEAREELMQYFQFERELPARLIHDDNFVNGKILNFREVSRDV